MVIDYKTTIAEYCTFRNGTGLILKIYKVDDFVKI